MKVLIVDDEKNMRELFALFFENEGCQVISVKDGKEAIDLIGENSQNFNLVVTDNHMPKISGIKLIKWIKIHHPNIKVALISGAFDPKICSIIKTIGADLVENKLDFAKPGRISNFLKEIQQ